MLSCQYGATISFTTLLNEGALKAKGIIHHLYHQHHRPTFLTLEVVPPPPLSLGYLATTSFSLMMMSPFHTERIAVVNQCRHFFLLFNAIYLKD